MSSIWPMACLNCARGVVSVLYINTLSFILIVNLKSGTPSFIAGPLKAFDSLDFQFFGWTNGRFSLIPTNLNAPEFSNTAIGFRECFAEPRFGVHFCTVAV
jgi:hypothetical protein